MLHYYHSASQPTMDVETTVTTLLLVCFVVVVVVPVVINIEVV